MKYILLKVFLVSIGYMNLAFGSEAMVFNHNGEQTLQGFLDEALPGSTIVCDGEQQLELSEALRITKAVTLKGLNARLPQKLGLTSLIIVHAEGVSLYDLELHGNYDSVDQEDRAPLIQIRKGAFRIERCTFYNGSKDGVEVSPLAEKYDIVGGAIRDIKAFRMGRDAVSISGGNFGQRVRDVTIENVSLKMGYLRGAVEISDGTDNIQVRGVYAEDCLYAIDVQDHRGESAANTNIQIEDVSTLNCKHIIRTRNSPRGHKGLVLRNFRSNGGQSPVHISNTADVRIEGMMIKNHQSRQQAPLYLNNCQQVTLKNVLVESTYFSEQPLEIKDCEAVRWDRQNSVDKKGL